MPFPKQQKQADEQCEPLFPVGPVFVSHGAQALYSPQEIYDFVSRHDVGDWGCVCKGSHQSNHRAAALLLGSIVSLYPAKLGQTIVIATELNSEGPLTLVATALELLSDLL